MEKGRKFILMTAIILCSTWVITVNTYGINANKIPEMNQIAKSINDFIPKGWKLNYKIEDDFNNDNLTDVAMVIEQNFKYQIGDQNAPERTLLIAFKQKDNTYKLVKVLPKAILKADEGGIWGDPFYKGLSSKKGVLSISFYGGSADRWALDYKFRFQNDDWYLIGATIHNTNVNTGNTEIKDYNLLTGKMMTGKGLEGSKLIGSIINRGKRKLLKLDDFYPWVEVDKDF